MTRFFLMNGNTGVRLIKEIPLGYMAVCGNVSIKYLLYDNSIAESIDECIGE